MTEHTSTRGPRGIPCPRCGCRHFYTTHTQPTSENRIRRRKSCRQCGHKIVTVEVTLNTLRQESC